MADQPDAWRLSAQLKPDTDAPTEKAGVTDVASPAEPAWAAAASDVRTTVKWMIGAFAAIGAVMFAKGFVTTPQLNWETDTLRLLLALLAGAIGLASVGFLISQAVRVLRPSVYSLGTIPPDLIKQWDASPEDYYTGDTSTLEDFKRHLTTSWTDYDHAKTDYDELVKSVKAVEDQLKAAKDGGPGDVKALQAELDRASAEKRRKELIAQIRTLNLNRRLKVRDQLVARAAYLNPDQTLSRYGKSMTVAAVGAAVAGIAFQFLLAAPADESSDTSSGTPIPAFVAQLVMTDTAAGKDLWTKLSLNNCAANPKVPSTIFVLVASGKGTPTDPHVVSTLPTAAAPECAFKSFNVIDEVAHVVRTDVPITVTYTPNPSSP